MLAVYSGLAPRFGDYLLSAIMELSTGRLFLAQKGHGAWLTSGAVQRRLHTSSRGVAVDLRVYVDRSLELTRKVFAGLPLTFQVPTHAPLRPISLTSSWATWIACSPRRAS